MLLQIKNAFQDLQIVILTNTSCKHVEKGFHSQFQITYWFRPYYSNCDYCHIKYDVIGHLEDSADDIAYIAIKQNLTTLLPELNKVNQKTQDDYLNSHPVVAARLGILHNKAEHYMSQLNIDLKKKIYELYQIDFDLFGYDPN